MSEILQFNGTDIIFHTGLEMAFNTEAKVRGGRFASTSTIKLDPNSGLGDVAFWGVNNDWPQRVIEEIDQSDLLRPLIHSSAPRHMGAGLRYGVLEIDEKTGRERPRTMRVPEINRWLNRTNINKYCYQSLIDWDKHGNVFAELQMTYDNLIASIYRQEPARCRLEKKRDDGRITGCYLSGKWPEGAGSNTPGVVRLPSLDPDYDVAGQILGSRSARYILPIRLLVDDNDYYAKGHWHGLIEGGYLELAKAIIQFKRYLVKNMSTIRYHIEIASEFWPLYFGQSEWDKLDHEGKRNKKQEVVDGFTKWVTGLDKTNRTLMTEMISAELDNRKEFLGLWKINPIKLDIPTGAYIEDSAEVDAKIIRAFMDQSLYGATPSKDRNSAGSGSDKRIAHTIDIMDSQVETDMILAPLYVASEVNGWNDRYAEGDVLRWWFRTLEVPTADEGKQLKEAA